MAASITGTTGGWSYADAGDEHTADRRIIIGFRRIPLLRIALRRVLMFPSL
jgi:hypothetical protein